jgi:hypothetical protein
MQGFTDNEASCKIKHLLQNILPCLKSALPTKDSYKLSQFEHSLEHVGHIGFSGEAALQVQWHRHHYHKLSQGQAQGS